MKRLLLALFLALAPLTALGGSLWDYSTTPASNNSSPPNGAPEGMAPSTVNDTMREFMARAAGALKAVATSGTNTYTATLAPAPTALVDGMTVHLRNTNASTSTAPTLQINGLGSAGTITRLGGLPLAPGDLPAGHEAVFRYKSSDNTWILMNPSGTDVLSRVVSRVTVSNTGAATNLISFSVPANTLSTVRAIEVELFGDLLNNTGSDDSVVFEATYGGSTFFKTGSLLFTTSANRRSVHIRVILYARNATNAQGGHGLASVSVSNTVNSPSSTTNSDLAVTSKYDNLTVDSTAAQTLTLTSDFITASANLELRIDHAVARLIY